MVADGMLPAMFSNLWINQLILFMQTFSSICLAHVFLLKRISFHSPDIFNFLLLSLDHIHSLYQFLPHLYINPYHLSMFINTHSLWNACCSSLHLTVVKSILRINVKRTGFHYILYRIIQHQEPTLDIHCTIILHTTDFHHQTI